MKHTHRFTPLTLGQAATDTELAHFFGGVTEGGCIPNPIKETKDKLNGVHIHTFHHIQ